MTSETNSRATLLDGGWPWAGSLCALHALGVGLLAYGVLGNSLGLSVDALLWAHWLWLGWPVTGAWRGTRHAVGAKIAFCIGLLAWIASCYFAIWSTLALFMHT